MSILHRPAEEGGPFCAWSLSWCYNGGMRNLYFRARTLVIEHERLLSYGGLIFGFIFDAIFFERVDLPFENIGIILHFVVGFVAIGLMQVRQDWYARHHLLGKLRLFLPFVMQFAIGGLFGKFIIFYSKSGALVQSWPFLIMLAVLFIGNESFRGRYEKLNFRLAIFFTALFSYSIFLVPIVTKEISDRSFILGSVLSLAIMVVIVRVLHRFIENIPWGEHMSTYGTMVGIFVAFHVMYFANIIPPLPLSLQDAGVYHSVERASRGSYRATSEPQSWLAHLRLRDTIHMLPGRPLYAYSAIFSPTLLNTEVVHKWYRYDPVMGEWLLVQTVSLPIVGGRDNGYRTYSLRSQVAPGLWRVAVGTPRGQLIGRMTFEVVRATTTPTLQVVTLE